LNYVEGKNVNIKTFLYTILKERCYVLQHIMPYYSFMDKQTISFRLESNKVAALDALAATIDRDRTYVLGEAVKAYLEIQQWQLKEIEAGIAEADAGQVLDHRKVKAIAAKWRYSK
jgi:predicted transcriptional regulator